MMVVSSSRPSIGVARKQQEYNTRAFNQIRTKPPGRWDNADRGVPQRPRSQKPVTPPPASWHTVPSVAFELGLRILATGPAALPTVSHFPRPCAPIRKVVANATKPGPALVAAGGNSSSDLSIVDAVLPSRGAARQEATQPAKELPDPAAVGEVAVVLGEQLDHRLGVPRGGGVPDRVLDDPT
jgi:hypothetical protein